MHNQPEPMTSARAQASRALAVWLLNNFWCDDCRGEWMGDLEKRAVGRRGGAGAHASLAALSALSKTHV